LEESPATSKVVAALINTDFYSTSNFQLTLNLCGIFNQFLIGIICAKFFFAFVFKSKVCKTFGGVDLPINLYIRAVPSGIGKNKEAL
jgi:hypothetical protein